jgi:nucleoside-diphosphate-sugar epimerase
MEQFARLKRRSGYYNEMTMALRVLDSPLPLSSVIMTSIPDVARLEEMLSEPSPAVVECLQRHKGDLLLLGVGGKMGPTLARMVHRASKQAGVERKVFGAARFSTPGLEQELRLYGIEPIRCDLLDEQQLAQLPDCPLIIHMVGMKFGTTGQSHLTWAMNAYLPGMICRRFRRSKIVAFSTGNVYGLAPVNWGGSRENDVLHPVGEYAWSALGRERILEYHSRVLEVPLAILRLNYATEMRYGVLVDVGSKVLQGEPVDVAMGHLNALWQGDANAMTLLAFDHVAVPPFVVNLAGPELLSVRRVAQRFGELFGKEPSFTGCEGPDALLSNSQQAVHLFGYPAVGPEEMIEWIADWLQRGGPLLGKPTHYEVRSGRF